MSTRDASHRLRRLEQILVSSKPAPLAGAGDQHDPATVHLDSVPLERIRQIAAELHDRGNSGIDEVDAVAMRLLLNDYTVAVAHLRAVVREAGQRIDAVAEPLNEIRRFMWREEKLREGSQQALEEAQ